MNISKFFKDFTNKGALLSEKPFLFIDLLKIGIPNILGLIAVSTEFWLKIVSIIPHFAILTRLLLPLLLFIYIVQVISGKTKSSTNLNEKVYYSYNQTIRNISKILFLPMLLISLFSLVNSFPSGLKGIKSISGKLINISNNEPFSNVTISIIGDVGDVISKQDELIDDEGFFYSDIKWLGSKPSYILISSKECGEIKVILDDTKSQFKFNSVNNIWYVQCK